MTNEENSVKNSANILDNFDDSHKLRGGVYFVDELPLTPSGKIVRRLARGIAEKKFSCRNKVSDKTT